MRESRGHIQPSQLQGSRDDFLAQLGEVVLVPLSDLLDQAADLARVLAGQQRPEMAVLESADHEAVPVYNLAAVLEESDVVGGRLDTQDDPQLVVHLDRHPAHVVLDAGVEVLDAGVEIIADLGLHVPVQLLAQEGRHVARLDGVDGRAREDLVERPEVGLALKDDIGGVRDLHQAPVIPGAEVRDGGAVGPSPPIQLPMQGADDQLLGQLLSPREVLDLNEGVVGQGEADPGLTQLSRQVVVAVEVELEPKRHPRWHSQVAQPQSLIDEVEVVVQALRIPRLEEQFARVLVVPRPERRTWLHRREDVDRAGMVAPLAKDLLDPPFLAEVAPPLDELDLQAVLPRQTFGVVPNLIPKGLGELGEGRRYEPCVATTLHTSRRHSRSGESCR